MDLLYYLQTIRLASPDWVNTVFAAVSESVLLLVPLIAAIVYWCVDKKKGTFLFCAFVFALLCNELLKLTFCVYRPWILDSRLTPAPQVTENATNYSFPSSHCCATACIMTSLSLCLPKNRKLHVFSVVFTLLIMFCRMYLGCHSLMDVCCGALIGLSSAFLFYPMLEEGFDEDRFTRLLVPVCCLLALLSSLYILLKPYPMDYQADGSLLVDPAAMWPDAFGSLGLVAGLGIGLFLERTYIRFALPRTRKKTFLRVVLGAVLFALLYAVILKKLFSFLDPSPAKFLRFFFCALFIDAGYPYACRKFHI